MSVQLQSCYFPLARWLQICMGWRINVVKNLTPDLAATGTNQTMFFAVIRPVLTIPHLICNGCIFYIGKN